MVEPGGEADFSEETVPAEHSGQLGAQDLKGNLTIVPQVLGEIDGRHPAPPEFPDDFIPRPQRFGQSHGISRHSCSGGGECFMRQSGPLAVSERGGTFVRLASGSEPAVIRP